MKENKGKQYYLTVKNTITGKKETVYVTEEVYRAYKGFDRAEKKRKQRMWRCKIPREGFSERQKSFLKRCNKKCSECPYGEQMKDSVVSLDTLREENAEVEDYTFDPATVMTEQSQSDYEKSRLAEAVKLLLPRQQEMVRLFYFENKSQREIAELLGIDYRTVQEALQRVKASLKRFFEKS